ncbi:LADA_0H13146g1_1 [Lachancea dasiensis]|uniref:LADA_0H13146g1_1 n=1 Tax=Lachancea dasiensis TaxID=1072105 RepID=A0A1G4K413_9SACH|nr:LADA_0H13146g1_1 [Lachancea dasiensis]
MLSARLLSTTQSNDITSVLAVAEASKLLVSNKDGHVLVYAFEGLSLRLTQTYHHLMKNNGGDAIIQDMLYAHQLATVFAICGKSIVLLNSSNLNQFDKIVEKRGIKQAWVFEEPSEKHGATTALLIQPSKTSKLKLFLWNDRSFKNVSEMDLSSRDERIISLHMNKNGVLIATNVNSYFWCLKDLVLVRLSRTTAPKWPRNIREALMELGNHQAEFTGDLETASISSESALSRKLSLGHFFQGSNNRGALRKEKLIFQPTDSTFPVILDGSSQTLRSIAVSGHEAPQVSVRPHRHFFDANGDFDQMQHLSARLLLLNNKEGLRIVDYQYNFNYLELKVPDGIKEVIKGQGSSLVIWTNTDKLQFYNLVIDDELDELIDGGDIPHLGERDTVQYLQLIVFYESILSNNTQWNLCESYRCANPEQNLEICALKLRDLVVLWCLDSFESCQRYINDARQMHKVSDRALKLQEFIVKSVFENFIKFMAPPELVIGHCLPSFLTKTLDGSFETTMKMHTDRNTNNIPATIMNKWCLPYLTDTRRILYNLAKYGTVQWNYESLGISFDIQFFLLNQHQEHNIHYLLDLVDTSIFKIYLEYNPAMVGPFTRVPNYCDFETVVEELGSRMKIQELVDYYYMKNKHESALRVLTELEGNITSVDTKDVSNSIKKLVVDYLKKLPHSASDILFKYTNWLVERFPEDTIIILNSIFINHNLNCAALDFVEVYNYIDQFDHELSIKYLEFVIDDLGTTNKLVYMKLIGRYLEDIQNNQTVRKLEAIVKSTTCYEPRSLARLLDSASELNGISLDTSLTLKRLKTYPLKILNEHEESLHILFEELASYNYCALYCTQVYQDSSKTGLMLFNTWFEMIIKKSEKNRDTRVILRFLEEFGSRLESAEALKKLPPTIPLKDLQQILGKGIEGSSLRKNQVRMKKNLLQVELVNKTFLLNQELGNYCVIADEQKCFVCHKVLNSSRGEMILWYSTPDGKVLTHYSCRQVIEEKLSRTDQ